MRKRRSLGRCTTWAGVILVAILDLVASHLPGENCFRKIGRRRPRCDEALRTIYSPVDLDKWMWSRVNGCHAITLSPVAGQ